MCLHDASKIGGSNVLESSTPPPSTQFAGRDVTSALCDSAAQLNQRPKGIEMSHPKIDVGVYVAAKPPLGAIDALVAAAQDQRLDSVFVWDHLQDFVPSAIWDKDFAWFASPGSSPHEPFEFQTVLGYLAAKTSGLRLGVGVTEPIRRHPVLLAQAALTLAHLSQRPPILGIGAGERENTEPYGLDFSRPVGRLEEALQIIRRCFDGQGPFDFEGEHFRLRGAVLDLPAPEGRTPEIWVAAHGPRMLRLTGRYGDGWYPFLAISPDDYATRLAAIRAAALEAGRDPEAITPALQALVVVAPTEAEARAMLNAKAVRFFGLLLPAEEGIRAAPPAGGALPGIRGSGPRIVRPADRRGGDRGGAAGDGGGTDDLGHAHAGSGQAAGVRRGGPELRDTGARFGGGLSRGRGLQRAGDGRDRPRPDERRVDVSGVAGQAGGIDVILNATGLPSVQAVARHM
jgi:phthiodiolone/phenolphthiodiolone dimycocerosates ketoreductase